MTFLSSCFESALQWPFSLHALNLHSSDLSVFVLWNLHSNDLLVFMLWICTPVTFLSSCFESALQWPFSLHALNMHSSDFASPMLNVSHLVQVCYKALHSECLCHHMWYITEDLDLWLFVSDLQKGHKFLGICCIISIKLVKKHQRFNFHLYFTKILIIFEYSQTIAKMAHFIEIFLERCT